MLKPTSYLSIGQLKVQIPYLVVPLRGGENEFHSIAAPHQ